MRESAVGRSKYIEWSFSYKAWGVDAVDWYPEGGGEKSSVELSEDAKGVEVWAYRLAKGLPDVMGDSFGEKVKFEW